jgi:hypothetical protein
MKAAILTKTIASGPFLLHTSRTVAKKRPAMTAGYLVWRITETRSEDFSVMTRVMMVIHGMGLASPPFALRGPLVVLRRHIPGASP